MSSRRGGGGKPFTPATTANGSSASSKGKNVEQLSHGVADITLDSQQDDGWEVIARKSKNRAGSTAAKQWLPQNNNPNPNPKPWGPPKSAAAPVNTWSTKAAAAAPPPPKRSPTGAGGNPRHFESGYKAPHPQPLITPPLQHGWNWQSRAAASQRPQGTPPANNDDVQPDKDHHTDVDDDDADSEATEDYSDEELLSDEFDSDSTEKSHDTLKKSKWFAKFFQIMDELKVSEINDPERQWHCPACHGGPGAIDWYRGLQPLMTHAKTKGGDRMKPHRKLAEALEEELRRKGTSVVPPGEAFGRWKGLKDDEKDHEIVWPPMVIIMNTKLEQDENDMWIGMGNQELLEYFSSYHPMKARHSYGPQGHRGMSLLIFEASARGYLEAERLHKHFAEQGTDRNAWNPRRALLYSGGKRLLYGFLAVKEDLDVFNQHSQGKSKLKYEMRSYHEMVVNQIRQMSEDNQQLGYYKDKYGKEQRRSKTLEESFDIVSQKLRKTMEENRIVRQRTKMQQEENKEEMDLQQKFYEDQLKIIRESRDAKEENFERLQQEERKKIKQSNADTSNSVEIHQRDEEISKFIKSQDKDMEDYVEEREKLIKAHEEKFNAMRRRHWEDEVELEKEFNAELTHLMDKYSPLHPKDTSNSGDV
ncbi:Zinc finger-XS domain containing protein [Trema orientale]|uniref:Zinc finger-XS domain containing protein n=1 Tax=Trema orientale TaxID=63057 RepID=A0A2P5EEM8_TREOI|nr:Zinc finger-XS domain containing protein [Trema orientale]